jgi:amino acid transporter
MRVGTETIVTTAAAAPDTPSGTQQLRRGALTLLDGTVIGVASTAPAYSLASAIAVVAGIGLFAPSAMVIAFLPMLGVAIGFYWLNRKIPNCGTSYAWVAKSLNPALGFFTGWVIIAADVIVMINLAYIAATSTLTLFGLDANNINLQVLFGSVWIAIMTWLVVQGIRISARSQAIMLALEYVIVFGFCLYAIVQVFRTHPAGSHVISLNWLLPWQAPGGSTAVLASVLGAIFIYWGWDTAANVNEETENSSVVPGLASIFSTFALLIIYVFAAFAIVSYLSPTFIGNNSSDVLTPFAQQLAGGNKIWYLMVLAILSSAAASTQTTILPTARVTFAMARDRIVPEAFGRVHARHLTPWVSSVVMGAVSIVLYAVSTWVSSVGSVATDAIYAIGLQIAFYYGLTGIAAAWYYRKLLTRSAKDLIFAGLFPFLGGVGFFYIFYEAALGLTRRQFWLGVGAMLIGIPLLAWSWYHNPAYYRQPTEAATDDEPVTAAQPATAAP